MITLRRARITAADFYPGCASSQRDVVTGLSWAFVPIAAALLLAAMTLCGCANSSIVLARSEIAAGHYTSAHRLLTDTNAKDHLSERERREVADGLCLSEYKIGSPEYTYSQQQRTCAAAVTYTGSESRPILGKVEEAEAAELTARVDNAIHSGDVADAESAIEAYNALRVADPRMVSSWSRQLWTLVEHNGGHTKAQARALAPAIQQLAREYPRVNGMSERAFREWIMQNMMVSGTSLVSAIRVHRHTVDLWIADSTQGFAAVNLDRFARVNDAQIARCRCDGSTNIALEGSDLPAYLVHLDPQTRRSEILILAQP